MENQTYFNFTNDGQEAILTFNGILNVDTAPSLIKKVEKELLIKSNNKLIIDISEIQEIDDFGILLIKLIYEKCKKSSTEFILNGKNENVENLLALYDIFESDEQKKRKKKSFSPVLRLGNFGTGIIKEALNMCLFMGDTFLALTYTILNPVSLRFRATLGYMQRIGVDAFFIVTLISFLLGLIMAFMSAVQLKQFGANIYVASLVGLSMTVELGPIMTCIIVAGRSGSAFAAEIGSMKISEEVDALKTMGFDITRFLVIPKLIAIIIVAPILTFFSIAFANLGGLIVGVGMLDLSAGAYMRQLQETISLYNLFTGLGKSIIFAILIAWIGCYKGLKTEGGADGVGRATTSAVVSGIFLIILADSIIAIIMKYWG